MLEGSLSPFIAGRACRYYLHGHMLRIFSTLLLAIALLLSPLAMGGGAAHAMTTETSSAAAAVHCAEDGAAPQQEKDAPKANVGCAVSCAALPAAAPPTRDQAPPQPAQLAAMAHRLLSGIEPEGETPPPRIAPEI